MTMTPEQLTIVLSQMLARRGVNENTLTWESNLEYDLALDYFDIAGIVLELERRFQIDISDAEWKEVNTYFSLVTFVARKIAHLTVDA